MGGRGLAKKEWCVDWKVRNGGVRERMVACLLKSWGKGRFRGFGHTNLPS